jgi:hypothetical protein
MDRCSHSSSSLLAAGLAAFYTLLPAAPSDARLRVWGTEDPADAANEPTDDPGDPWTETDANDEINVNLAPGDTLYLAARNDQDSARNKFWSIQLQGPGVDDLALLTPPADGGFDGFQTADDTTPVGKAMTGFALGPNFKRWNFRFTPQPRWERIILKPFLGVNGNIEVIADSLCTDAQVGFVDLTLADTSFDSPTGVNGSPRYTEFWVFPREHPADQAIEPSVVAPPGTGTWTSEFVGTDPTGETRPLGVKFVTAGAPPGRPNAFDHFDFAFSMLGAADEVYDAFVFDATSERYAQFSLPEPGRVLSLAMGIVLVAALARRRTATG